MPNKKAPLPLIKDRGQKTYLVMNQIAPVYTAPDFISVNNFHDLVTGLSTQEGLLGMKESAQAAAADALDAALGIWHAESVLTLKVARLKFGTKSSTWRNVTANAGSREKILAEGR